YIFEGLDAGDYKVQFEMPSDYKTWTEKGKGDGKNDSKVNFIKNTDNKVTTDVVTLKAGDKNLNQDAGVTKLGSIGDLLWNDANQNGKQDPGEEGLPGQKVTLNDDKGNEIATTTTDSNGKYKFENLLEGNYVVTFTKPDGYKFTAKEKEGVEAALDSNIDESGKATVTLGYGENNITVDAGILKVEPSIPNKEDKVGKIGDTVWLDKNNNGVQDEDEAGVDGVKITLYSEDGTKIAETMTKNGGKYLFDNLKYGDYKIVFELPKGYKFTKQGSIDEDLDSDADNTGLTKIIKLDEKTSIKLTIDAGVVKCDDKLVSTSENEKILKNKNEKIINAIVKTGEVLGTNQLLLLGMISGVLGVIVIKRKR
ncbi:Cna protein B-type domain-containing protein, partial [Clostridium cavendishii DSM 21758]